MYFNKSEGSEESLIRAAKEIESMARSPDSLTRKKALQLSHELALSAEPKSVQVLYAITPKLIQTIPAKQLQGFLRLWAGMYNGSTLVLNYPNFTNFAQDLPPLDTIDPVLKSKTDKVQFFDDSYVSEESNLEASKVSFQKIMYDIAEIEVIKDKITTTQPTAEKLEEYRTKMIAFQMNHDQDQKIKLKTPLGVQGAKIGQRLEQSLEWCRHYLNSLMKLSNKQISFGEFQHQLQPHFKNRDSSYQMVPGKSSFARETVTVPNAILAESVQNSKGSFGTGHKMHGIGLTLNKNSIGESVKKSMGSPLVRSSQQNPDLRVIDFLPHTFQSSPGLMSHNIGYKPIQTSPKMVIVQQERNYTERQSYESPRNYQSKINEKFISSDKQSSLRQVPSQQSRTFQHAAERMAGSSLVRPELVITKYKPHQPELEPNLSASMGKSMQSSVSRSRKRIFSKTIIPSPKATTHPKSPKHEITLSDGFKLSDFVNQKQKRKNTAQVGELNQAPEWVVAPFYDYFQSQDLFSRFRKTCLHKKSTLLKDSGIEIICNVLRASYNCLNVQIHYRNFTNIQKNIRVIYNIAKSFKVANSKNVKSKFILRNQLFHKFDLEIQQFPLRSCTVELTIECLRHLPIPLPITVTRFVKLQYIDRQNFFLKWNEFAKNHYYTTSRIQYSRKVLNVSEMTFLFPQMTELGKKQNYSYDQFGCIGKYEYYDLEWLMVFAFNVDSLLTIEILCIKQVTQEEAQFLEYYIDNLTMLISRVQVQ